MKCPYCNNKHTNVIKTYNKVNNVYRRRVCNRCKEKFNTIEYCSDGWDYRKLYKNLTKDIERLHTRAKEVNDHPQKSI